MSTRRGPTSEAVARRAGVSRSTVSVVLNGATNVTIAEETRLRVLEAAKDLGYVPSAAARQLASGRARTIGLVISYAENLRTDAFVPRALYSLNDAARERGFRVLVEALEDVTDPSAYRELVRGKQIDGLIVLDPRADDRALPKLIEEGYPVVVIGHAGREEEATRVDVDVDNVAAARTVTEHLTSLGRTRVAHVTYGPFAHHSVARRRRGWSEALRAAGIEPDPAWVEPAAFSADSGAAAMRRLLARTTPDAVFAGNDTVAFGAMTALREAGLRIPEDVAVAGFDDIPLAAHANPPLTTVRLPAVQMGRAAAERLIRRIEGDPPATAPTFLDTELVVRASSVGSATRTTEPPPVRT